MNPEYDTRKYTPNPDIMEPPVSPDSSGMDLPAKPPIGSRPNMQQPQKMPEPQEMPENQDPTYGFPIPLYARIVNGRVVDEYNIPMALAGDGWRRNPKYHRPGTNVPAGFM